MAQKYVKLKQMIEHSSGSEEKQGRTIINSEPSLHPK